MTIELKKILLVEDQLDMQLVAQLALSSLGGYEVSCCASGEEALRLARAAPPDLVLLDYQLPGLNGESTLQELHQIPQLEQLAVIMCTASATEQDVARYRKLGAIGVVAKPYDPLSLAGEVERLWAANQVSS